MELRVTAKSAADGSAPKPNELAVLSLPCPPGLGSALSPPASDAIAALYKAEAAVVVITKVWPGTHHLPRHGMPHNLGNERSQS